MGVSGSGKSTLGIALADALKWRFVEGDDYHSAANHAKMARGEGLTDADRKPWLDELAHILHEPRPTVLACSALKRAYRDLLRPATFVWATAPADVLALRLRSRQGHFVDERLLTSQLATLEPPIDEADVITVDATQPVRDSVQRVLEVVGA
jgi:gluconokinase